eukprot:EC822240.1.p1 GENE.EC822240.1~~EC822240.1.p1  ORF type:complete len:175 (+),score=58.82 EC822240.1:45-569(+)
MTEQQPLYPDVSSTEQKPQPQQPVISKTTPTQSYQQNNLVLPDRNDWIFPSNDSFDPLIPTILTLILPGVGHILIGQIKKGIFYFIFWYILSIIIGFIVGFTLFLLCPLFIVLYGYLIFILVDVFQLATKLKSGQPIHQGECSNIIAKLFVNLIVGESYITGDQKLIQKLKEVQ